MVRKAFLLFLTLCLWSLPAQSQKDKKDKLSVFKDSTDNAIDISDWLSKAYGFVPIISIITEPAVGYGAVAGALFIHQSMEDARKQEKPPSMTAVGGFYTESESWSAGVFHQGSSNRDIYRYTGVAGYIDINLSVYADAPGSEESAELGVNLKGGILNLNVLRKLGQSNSYLGLQYTYLGMDVVAEGIQNDTLIFNPELELRLSGLGVIHDLDTRDNTFTPNKGIYMRNSFMVYDEALGSNLSYSRFDNHIVFFFDHFKKWVLGLRLDYRAILGDAPYISKPFVPLRGIPAFRYQGDQVIVIETEERWDFARRWSLVGFAGVGKGYNTGPIIEDTDWAYSVGAGFRYLLARKYNIYSGLDVARGPEQWAVYIQFGHYWNGL